MAAAKYDMTMEQGASFYKKFTFKDNIGNPIDLTGNTYAGQIRKATGDTSILLTFTIAVLNQVTNKGEIEVTATPSQTAALPLKVQKAPVRTTEVYCYDIEVTYPDTKVDRVLEGTITVSPEVTK